MIPFRNTFDPIPTIVQRSLHLILVLLSGLCATAQDCSIPFTEPLFEVQERSDIWYGNAPRFNGGSDSLRLNLFTPIGDGQTERPLVIAIHGGGLIEGHRNELNDYCRIMASMGWAAATVTYRLGYYGTGILDPPYAYDPNEMRRAIFRAMQDAKGAIRFLKGRHEEDSTSTNNVLLAGFSAGSITAMHAAYLDQPEEKPAAAFAIGDVQHFFDFYPRPDLGSIDGDLNQNGSNASILGVSNFFGALLDTTFIGSATDPALYSYHQTMDPVVACGLNRPYWGIGLGIPDNLPYLFGSCMLDLRVQHTVAPLNSSQLPTEYLSHVELNVWRSTCRAPGRFGLQRRSGDLAGPGCGRLGKSAGCPGADQAGFSAQPGPGCGGAFVHAPVFH
jgi:alpha/beta superfamily hydrolase